MTNTEIIFGGSKVIKDFSTYGSLVVGDAINLYTLILIAKFLFIWKLNNIHNLSNSSNSFEKADNIFGSKDSKLLSNVNGQIGLRTLNNIWRLTSDKMFYNLNNKFVVISNIVGNTKDYIYIFVFTIVFISLLVSTKKLFFRSIVFHMSSIGFKVSSNICNFIGFKVLCNRLEKKDEYY